MKSAKANNQFNDPEDWHNFAKYLREINRFILSDYWENFIKTVVETSHKRIKTLEKGFKLVRARTGISQMEFDDGNVEPWPISPHEMGPPPKHLTQEGRLNATGIPYLYLATNIDTAVAEVRPWIESELTIGYFKISEDIKIIDTSNDTPKSLLSKYQFTSSNGNYDIKKRLIETYTLTEKEEYIWGDINSAFSTPISPNDLSLRYIPTQYLAEKLKTNNYDGIAYKSSLSQDGYNIALFNPNKAKCVGCRMFKVKELKYKYEESGNAIGLSKNNEVIYPRVVEIRSVDTENHREKSD